MESTTVLKSEQIPEAKPVFINRILTLMNRTVGCLALLMILTTISAEADECDFIAMLAQNGTFVHQDQTNADVYFDFLKAQSDASNPDGYGVLYYDTELEIQADQWFYLTGSGHYYHSDIPGDQDPMDDAIAAIYDPINDAVIVLGHDRLASPNSGNGNHPFRINWGDRTYTFMQNGTLSSALKNGILTGLRNGEGYFDNIIPPWEVTDWEGDPDDIFSWIDSELFFHYLMFFIIQENEDVLTALFTALNQTDFHGLDVRDEIYDETSTVNFVLSDGEGLYLFRNASDAGHQMSWTRHTSGLIGVKTDNTGTDLEQYDLVHIPIEGSIAHFDGLFEYEGGEFDVYSYDTGTNWVCYPIMPTVASGDETDTELHFSQITPYIDDMMIIHENEAPAIWDGADWFYGGTPDIVSTEGYIVKINDGDYGQYNHIVTGEEVINPVSFVTLQDGMNYVPYFLEGSQHPSDAFPSNVLDNMISIEAKDWFMVRINDEFYVKRKCPDVTEPEYVECYTLHYGAMYILNMDLTGTIDFIYHQPESPLELFVVPTPENFTFDDSDEYLKVVIEEIENGEAVIEIGAFQNGDCVGAEVVDGYPINLRVYAENLDGVTYEVIHDEPLYRTVPGEPAPPTRRTLAPAARRYINGATLLELTDITDLSTTQPSAFSAVSASPNPFNPSTEISFLLNNNSDVSLKVYNIRGQLVSTLLQGSLESGVYSCSWSGRTDSGNSVASGIYYFQLSNGSEQISQKLILLK